MDFIDEFNFRVDEVERFFQFLADNDPITHPDSSLNRELFKTMKASGYLLLYNLVEGAFTNALDKYFESFNSEGKCYKEFQNPIKAIWLKVNHGDISKKNASSSVEIIDNISDEVINIKRKNNSNGLLSVYQTCLEKLGSGGVAGNLDPKRIRDQMERFGLPIGEDSCPSLHRLKKKRNDLAHGNKSFSEEGAEVTLPDLEAQKNEIIEYMRGILDQVKQQIESKGYLIRR